MIELKQLYQLIAISKEGTFSRAAERLYISQPALTRSMQRLEAELNVKLFSRTKNQATLNELGKEAVEMAQAILNEAENMKDTLISHQLAKTHLVIGACAPAPYWEVRETIMNHYPDAKIKEDLSGDEDLLLKNLKEDKYGICILSHPIDDNHYICTHLFSESLYLSVPNNHPLAYLKSIEFKDLTKRPILISSNIGIWKDYTESRIPDHRLIYQDDDELYREIQEASALPVFRTDYTVQLYEEDRFIIPIKDATLDYYVIYPRSQKQKYGFIK